jgi:hypothetical protein
MINVETVDGGDGGKKRKRTNVDASLYSTAEMSCIDEDQVYALKTTEEVEIVKTQPSNYFKSSFSGAGSK